MTSEYFLAVQDDELIEEFKRRFSNGILFAAKDTPGDSDTVSFSRHLWGSRVWCLGAAQHLHDCAVLIARDAFDEHDEDEP